MPDKPTSPSDFASSFSDSGDVRLGPYRLLREIGRGAQGTVYLAEDTGLGRQVAIKVLDTALAKNAEAIARFRREAAITSRLDNPGICAVYATGEDRGSFWIAMRYVEGESLAKQISTARDTGQSVTTTFVVVPEWPVQGEADGERHGPESSGPSTWGDIIRVLAIFEKTARSLHVAHEAGVIHRDIKPGNLIVTKDGDPVILDFGLAQEVESEQTSLTHTGDIKGTPAYMSPEQIAAQRIRLDRRTDVYSLGVSLYECLTLKRPFDAPTREGLYQAILTKDALDPRELNHALPRDLKIVIEAALEKDRDRRYQTALDLAEDLRRVRMREPVLAKPVGNLLRLRRWAQRNPALATASAGILIALVITTVLLIQVSNERDAKQAALDDYDRLGDLSRLQTLVAEAETLWPAEPSRVEAMRRWVEQGVELQKRLDGHRDVRDRLRMSAVPYTEQDAAADFEAHAAEREQLKKLRTDREKLAAELAVAESGPASASTVAPSRPSLDDFRSTLAQLDAAIRSLDTRVQERLTWRFESAADQFKHETAARLVADLRAFEDPDPRKGLLASMRKRVRFAESVQEETIGKHQQRWAEAIRSIADVSECPEYGGLRIVRQLGLVPIHRDPRSGLWEFADISSAIDHRLVIPALKADGTLDVPTECGLVFVLIPAGTFWMGSQSSAAAERNFDPSSMPGERPPNPVALDPFFIAKFEMTQGQWEWITGSNPSVFANAPGQTSGFQQFGPKHPVEGVSWNDCVKMLATLGLDLPTEAQWECACRARTATPWSIGGDKMSLQGAANLIDRSAARAFPNNQRDDSIEDGWAYHAPAGSFPPNPFGLHDMHGNVNEWCRDGISQEDIRAGYRGRAGFGTGERIQETAAPYRAFRGGSFFDLPAKMRSAFRGVLGPSEHNATIGVRPARKLDS